MNTSSEKLDLFKINVHTSRYIIIMKQLEVTNFEIFAKESSSIKTELFHKYKKKMYGSQTLNRIDVLFSLET